MGGAVGKKPVPDTKCTGIPAPTAGPPGIGSLPIGLGIPGTSIPAVSVTRARKLLRNGPSNSEFNLLDIATNLTHRFSVLSGLSFISFVSVPPPDINKRPWSRVSRKRWHPSTLQNEYQQCKTVWPVAQTEALFLPEFPVGIEEKLKLIFLGEISRGAFGQVFHVKCASTNKEYAMKVLSKSQVCSLDAVSQVKQEVMIQHVCSHHPFITPLTRFWQTRKLLIVMTEYVGYGELQQLWRSLGRFPENLLTIFVAEIALALDFLHNAGIIFRDIKMENILLDVDGHIKVIDFGLARWLSYSGRTRTICGTLQFMAPEVLRGEDYNHSADWWSLGIVAYSLLAGHYPVTGYDDHITMSSAVEKYSYSPPAGVSKSMKSLLNSLLDRCPTTRLHSLRDLQKEPAFFKMDFDVIKDKKISPRKLLEEYIEGRSRPYFEEFVGLSSTPKKTSSGAEMHRLATTTSLFQPSCNSLHKGIMQGMNEGAAKRSASSPLLSSPLMHPGRLGHHDLRIKSNTPPSHNGAAVPILQSPLLRLARGQNGPTRSRSQKAVSASTLPTAVSPLLVNVRGNRRCHMDAKRMDKRNVIEAKQGHSSSYIATQCNASNSNIINGMNGVYKKCASEECVRSPTKGEFKNEVESLVKQTPLRKEIEEGSPQEQFRCISDNPFESDGVKTEFFENLITSTPKKESYHRLSCQGYCIDKCRIINGNFVANNNKFNALGETDFDDAFENFPWISESIDS